MGYHQSFTTSNPVLTADSAGHRSPCHLTQRLNSWTHHADPLCLLVCSSHLLCGSVKTVRQEIVAKAFTRIMRVTRLLGGVLLAVPTVDGE